MRPGKNGAGICWTRQTTERTWNGRLAVRGEQIGNMKTNRKFAVQPYDHQSRRRRDPGSEIRIRGQWLTRAGFPPGTSVLLTVISPGVVEIRLNAPAAALCRPFGGNLERLTEKLG
jgi:hypothetical protein